MSAVVIPFPATQTKTAPTDEATARPPILTKAWADQHLPLIEAALVLLHADDAQFAKRCRELEQTEGRAVLESLSAQIERLGAHIGDVVEALGMAATRIRTNMAAAN